MQEILGRAHQAVVFGDRTTHAIRVDFLEGIRAEQGARHLAGDANERNRVQLGIGDGRQEVGRARARGGETHGRFAAGARQSLRNEARPLFVAGEHVPDLLAVRQGVVERQVGPTGDPGDSSNALAL